MAASDIFRSTATGGATGLNFGPIGAVYGAGAGLLLGIGDELFGTSDEEERQKRYQEFLRFKAEKRKELLQQKEDALARGAEQIGKANEGLIRRERYNSGRRASAAGRTDTESYQIPIVGRIAEANSGAISDFNYRTNAEYDRALQQLDNMDINAAYDYANRPIQPSLVDTISEIAPLAGQAYSGYKYGQALDKYINSQETTPAPPPQPQVYGNSPYTPYRYRRQNPNPLFNY